MEAGRSLNTGEAEGRGVAARGVGGVRGAGAWAVRAWGRVAALVLVCAWACGVAAGQTADQAAERAVERVSGVVDEGRFREDLARLTAEPSRVAGSAGHARAEQYLREQLRQLADRGVELQEHAFELQVPVTRSATLGVAGEPAAEVYPFWPASVRLNTTPAEGITGRVVYCGDASGAQLRPGEVRGNIAAVEASGRENWSNAFYFGARAVLVLGSPATTNADLRHYDLMIPADLPRFYVPPGELAERIRRGGIAEATLKADVRWERRRAVNFYALVRGKSPIPDDRVRELAGLLGSEDRAQREAAEAELLAAGPGVEGVLREARASLTEVGQEGADDLLRRVRRSAMFVTAAYDATSLVPDLGNGAGQAVQVAALLGMARELAERPQPRPVVLAFLGADGIAFQSARQMFMAFGDMPRRWEVPLEALDERLETYAGHLARLKAALEDPASIDPSADADAVDRVIKIIETDQSTQQDRLFRLRLLDPASATEADRAELRDLEVRQILLSKLRAAFQKRPGELASAELRADAVGYLGRAAARLEGTGDAGTMVNGASGEGLVGHYTRRRDELRRRVELYRWLAGRLGIETDPSGRANANRVVEMQVALDLTGDGVRAGPVFQGRYQDASNITQISNYRDWFSRLSADFESGRPGTATPATDDVGRARAERARWFGAVKPLVDFEPLSGTRSIGSWLAAPLAIGSEMCQAWGVPGFTLATLDDMRLRRDTPNDRVERIDLASVLRQYGAVRELMWRAWADPAFRGPVENHYQREQFEGQVVSLAPGRPVPDLPREGFLVATYHTNTLNSRTPAVFSTMNYTVGMRRHEIRGTDAEGVYRYEGLPKLGSNERQQFLVLVYKLADDGQIVATSDFGRQAGDIKPYADIKSTVPMLRSVPFKCAEVTLTGLFDPRFLQDLGDAVVLDARRNADPQRYARLIFRQVFSGFVEPDVRSFLLFRYGRVGNRLVLLNMADAPQGGAAAAGGDAAVSAARGLTRDQLENLGPLNLQTAQDFWRLNGIRLEGYRAAGVSSSMLDDLQKQSAAQIENARAVFAGAKTRAAEGAGGGATAAEVNRDANGAWANQTRVYSASADMANDVIRAAIFLLLLCVPFAFCMERLLVGSPNVYRQIAGVIAIFSVMMVALWSFHPAFKISSSPLIIVLAFAIITMSCVVIFVVYSKFDTELKRIRSGRGTAEAASLARASVLMSAVLLGIANMRKRKFRTALTAITIVLITFAVLAFTSSSKLLDTTTLATGEPTRYPGLMLRQRGFRPMPPAVLENLQAALGERQVVQRWWNVNAGDPRDQVHIVSTPAVASASSDAAAAGEPRVFAAAALLGLSPGEGRVGKVAEVLGRDKFAALEQGERDIVYLPKPAADRLGVGEGDTVRIGGVRVRVAGVYDPERFDREAVMLSGEPVAPLRYTQGALDAGGRGLGDTSAEALELDGASGAAELQTVYEHLSASQFAIVPAELSRMLPNASLRSVTVRLADEAEVKKVGDDLSRRFALALFAGYDDGVRMLAAGNLTAVSGAGQVAIPLAIAGLIIFNTMMGSIAERKREIHVYTSLGLAPLHVGALFVAEALTYGLIGAVFGYVIGQGVGTALMHLGWLGTVTLNYSGTSAMLTLGLILVVVLLSALVPARLASKIAAPSIERNWRVPLPKGDQITADLPFTINATAAQGAVAYLAEFFDAHREGSIGKFSAGKVEVFSIPDEAGRPSRGLKTVVWLTPFDLGVRQHLMLLIHPGQYPDIYEVQVVLQRLSGDDASWYRMNRTFLTELRKQFLQWRSLSPQRMKEYVEESKQLFDQPIDKVVETAPGDVLRLG